MYDALLYLFLSFSVSIAVAMYMQNSSGAAASSTDQIATWEEFFLWRDDGSHDHELDWIQINERNNPPPDLVFIVERFNVALDELGHSSPDNPILVQRRAALYQHRYLRCILGHVFEGHIRFLERLRILRAELEEIDRSAAYAGVDLAEQRRFVQRRVKQKLEKRAVRCQAGHVSPSHSPPARRSPPPPKAGLVLPRRTVA